VCRVLCLCELEASDLPSLAVECELCGKRYKSKASLYLHRSRKHRDQLRPFSSHQQFPRPPLKATRLEPQVEHFFAKDS